MAIGAKLCAVAGQSDPQNRQSDIESCPKSTGERYILGSPFPAGVFPQEKSQPLAPAADIAHSRYGYCLKMP